MTQLSDHAWGKPDENASLPGGLYLVATPIGNLRDITLRALDVLMQAQVIACEDTRTSQVLLRHYGISTPLVSYHDYSTQRVRDGLVERVSRGEVVALISDAGMPLIADPGFKLVRAMQQAQLPVRIVPGPSSVTSALALSGLPSDRFYFAGFIPAKSQARRQFFEDLALLTCTLVMLESPHRIRDSLEVMAACWPERQVRLCRELTKHYEEVVLGSTAEIAERTASGEVVLKGEMVLVVDGATDVPAVDSLMLDDALHAAMTEMSVRDAARYVSESLGLPRKQVYSRALALRQT